MKLRQIPCYVARVPSWSDCAWALRQSLGAHGCLPKTSLLQISAAALDTEQSGRLEKTLTHLLRTTDVAGTAVSTRYAAAPPRLVILESGLPLVKLGHFSGCVDRSLNRFQFADTIERSTAMPLDQWEGPREKLDSSYIQAWRERLRRSPRIDQPSPGRETYHVAKSSWSRNSLENEDFRLQRSSLGRRWRFYLASTDRWLEIEQDTATRLRFALHLQAENPVPATYEPRESGIRLNVPFLPSQEFRTLSLAALEPIVFNTPFEVHPMFGQFTVDYLTDRLGIAFQEARQ